MPRRTIVIIVVSLLVAGIGGGWWWYDSNERHIDDLMDAAYRYSGFPGDPQLHHLVYTRRRPGACGEGREDWVGEKASVRDDPRIGFSGAEPAAVRFEAEGWTVSRRLNTSSGGEPFPELYVSRGDDKIEVTYYKGAIAISASSGPCNPARGHNFPSDYDSHEVAHFDN
jgi:hypothetical protein